MLASAPVVCHILIDRGRGGQTVNSLIVRDERFDVFTANKRDGQNIRNIFRVHTSEV